MVGVIASVILPKLIDSALSSFSTWLDNLSKSRTTSSSASPLLICTHFAPIRLVPCQNSTALLAA